MSKNFRHAVLRRSVTSTVAIGLMLTIMAAIVIPPFAGAESPSPTNGGPLLDRYDLTGDGVPDLVQGYPDSDPADPENVPGYMQIVWIDSRASRFEYESGYEKWSVWVGVGFRFRHDASRPLRRHTSRFAHSIWHSPRKYVEVEHLDGRPVELAIRFQDRYRAPIFYQPGGFIQRRVLSEDDQWSTQIAAATVGLGQRPEPGIYRMRFKADAFGDAEGMVIDDSWHTFFIAEVSDDPTPQEDLPWYDLRVPHIEASRDMLEQHLEIYRELLGEQNRNTIMIAASLARVYISQEEYDRAEALLLEAHDAAVVTFGEQHLETIEIKNLLQELSEQTDD